MGPGARLCAALPHFTSQNILGHYCLCERGVSIDVYIALAGHEGEGHLRQRPLLSCYWCMCVLVGRMKAQADTRFAKIHFNEVYSKQIFQNMHRQMPYIVCTCAMMRWISATAACLAPSSSRRPFLPPLPPTEGRAARAHSSLWTTRSRCKSAWVKDAPRKSVIIGGGRCCATARA